MISLARHSIFILLLACTVTATADELRYAVDGIADPLKANVLSHVDTFQIGRPARLSENDYAEAIATAESNSVDGWGR